LSRHQAPLKLVTVAPTFVPASGVNVRWIIGTAEFQTVSGLAPDFIMPDQGGASLPTAGGMVCWGAPGIIYAPPPESWDHTDPENYIDCVAYGTYSGPSNSHTGFPTPLDAVGHSLQRVTFSNDNANDFVCGDPATPTNNSGIVATLPATTFCADDLDGDGLSNDDEVNVYGTDPNNPDSDGDGLNDGDEVNVYGTNPANPDSDGDGLDDGDEVNVYSTNPTNPDSDGDGLNDGDEVNVHSTDPANPDSDGEGLADGDEVNVYSTDPNDPDSDNDAFDDAREVYLGADPTDDCAATDIANNEGPPDAWPVDFNDDQKAALDDVIFAFVTTLAPDGLNQPATGPLQRVDLNGDGIVSMQDVILGYVTKLAPDGLNTVCMP
jgi:hypothetical protein